MADKDRDLLLRLIKKAKDLQIEEEKSVLRQRIEGQLLKFTNVMKGYQYRWFVIDPDSGKIQYYEKEEHKKSMKPRGALSLIYASICPSDEDSQTFIINAANGDLLRLKACDAKERQHWVNRLRAVAEYHSERAEQYPLIATLANDGIQHTRMSNSVLSINTGFPPTCSASSSNPVEQATNNVPLITPVADVNSFPIFCPGRSSDPKSQLCELFRQLELETQALALAVDATSIRSPELTDIYKNFLLSKATSQATLNCLRRCVDLIKSQELPGQENGQSVWTGFCGPDVTNKLAPQDFMNVSTSSSRRRSSNESYDDSPFSSNVLTSQGPVNRFPPSILALDHNVVEIPNVTDEYEDPTEDSTSDEEPEQLLSSDEHKNVVLHLLSQLKLGMDLTKVSLPTFMLEKHSLLEMFANYMAHPNLFINITDAQDPESRMLAFVQWYITAFHAGHKDTVAKKPYNPIIGETFHCSWVISPSDIPLNASAKDTSSPSASNVLSQPSIMSTSSSGPYFMRYCAEQVSHHPPVTAFCFTCPKRQMELTASIYTKSRFQGMSVSASMLGKLILKLGEHNGEEYHFSLPTAYARSILTMPWAELGDQIFINCPQTGYYANINFLVKPYYSDKLHRIIGGVFGPQTTPTVSLNSLDSHSKNTSTTGIATPNLVARVTGEWNNVIEFETVTKNPRKWSINVAQLPVYPKRLRSINQQRPEESRRLWQHVTSAMRLGNIDLATEKKRELENQQRLSEKYRMRHKFPFPVKYFKWNGSAWVFNRHEYIENELKPK